MRPIYFSKNSAHRSEDLICTNKLEESDLELFLRLQNQLFGRHFFAHEKKKNSSECECLVLTQYDDLTIYVIWKKIVILLKIKKVTRALEANF